MWRKADSGRGIGKRNVPEKVACLVCVAETLYAKIQVNEERGIRWGQRGGRGWTIGIYL